jgi:hypothetical protein
MPSPESQLTTWANQGSITQSANTYASIKGVLEQSGSPFAGKKMAIYLQGSYGNHTNVFGVDSDVDIVCCLKDAFQYDLSYVNAAAQDAFRSRHPINATYGYTQFKAGVTAWLKQEYGSDVDVGSKAIKIKASGNRRSADVLPCIDFRQYWSSSNGNDGNYNEGVHFVRADGTIIRNFPVQHYDNCVAKNAATQQYFKQTVRIFKNMRNRLIGNSTLKSGIAPSYFVEGMLWNVPNELYGASYAATCPACMNWLLKADKEKLVCANRIHWLIRDNLPTCWNRADFDTYLAAVIKQWNE